jgi:hypothetical protein
MINPAEIIDNLVTLLQDIPDLIELVGDDEDRIYAYHDRYPQNVSIDAAKAQMPSPGIMVSWAGTNPGSFSAAEVWKHNISITIRMAKEAVTDPPEAYYAIFRQLTKGQPESLDGVTMSNATVHASCNPMDTPSIMRQVDAAGIDYFEVSTSFTEIGDD